MKLLLNLPEKLNHKLKIYSAIYKYQNLGLAITAILSKELTDNKINMEIQNGTN